MRRPSTLRTLHVLTSTRIAPRMQRLRLTGEDLHHFDTDTNLHARLHIPAHRDKRSLEAFRAFITSESRNGSELVATRYYTIRRVDADAGWLDIDFVLHDKGGPGCHFACAAKPGDICGLSGPCGLGIKSASRYLLIGDETALPAITRIAERLEHTASAQIAIFADVAYFKTNLASRAGLKIEWISHKNRQSFFARLDALAEALVSTNEPHFIWIAGERRLIGCLRPLLSAARKSHQLCVPYWTEHS